MGPHDWPSLYPGIFLGFLVGLHSGGWIPICAGLVGGLAGAATALGLLERLEFENDFYSFALFVALSTVVAKLFILVAQFLSRLAGKRA